MVIVVGIILEVTFRLLQKNFLKISKAAVDSLLLSVWYRKIDFWQE